MVQTAASNEYIRYAARSDVGMKRAMNQDAFDVIISESSTWARDGHQFVVADGMGAHAAGELASQMAVEEFRQQCERSELPPRERIVAALKSANEIIHRRGQADTQLYNMGTTCSALLLLPEGALVGHVGDSRVYRCRGDVIHQLTFDHSLVWEMRAAGQISDESRAAAIPRNVITRCLGPHPDVEVDLEGYLSVAKGDRFLLCSDGLTGRISDEEIGVVLQILDPEETVDFLTDLANLRGGSDNITVVACEICSDELAANGDVPDRVSKPRKVETHPAWWLACGISLVVAIGAYQLAMITVAMVAALVFLFSAISVTLLWSQQRTTEAKDVGPQPPYAQASSRITSEFVLGICDTLQMVYEAVLPSCPDLDDVGPRLEELQRSNVDSVSGQVLIKELAQLANRLRDKL